jgi:hypothetical protein
VRPFSKIKMQTNGLEVSQGLVHLPSIHTALSSITSMEKNFEESLEEGKMTDVLGF